MGLRKKYINSTLVNKTCSKCNKTYPRDEEHFYRRQHHSKKILINTVQIVLLAIMKE